VALLNPVTFQGILRHPGTGASVSYAGTCVVAVDSQGRESLHVRGSVRRGGQDTPIVVLGHVDRLQSFIGRELEAAHDCVARHCRFEDEAAPAAAVASPTPSELKAA